jgi:hypothetical protein
VIAPVMDFTFPRAWDAEILARRPLILPARHYVYPCEAEEVERGALEILIKPRDLGAPHSDLENSDPFLATCALGFRDPNVPTGLWSAPNPQEICAVSGGYAYIIDTPAPEHFTMIPYRPVLAVRAVSDPALLLFVGHHSILAWGPEGRAWESDRLSDEGVTIARIDNGRLGGCGWEMMSDAETPFVLDLKTGSHTACD